MKIRNVIEKNQSSKAVLLKRSIDLVNFYQTNKKKKTQVTNIYNARVGVTTEIADF
jgi:hypothetical protein